MPQFVVRKAQLGEFGDFGTTIQRIVYAESREEAREEGAILLGVSPYEVEVHDMPAYESSFQPGIIPGGNAS